MGKFSEIFNFDNIGSKIKNFTKWFCWISILLIWISAPICFILLISDGYADEFCWIPVVAAIVGPAVLWAISWPMYAFGECVEDIHAIRNREGTTKEAAIKRDAEAKAKRQAAKAQLSISDIEGAASAFLNRRVSISDIACTLIYVIPKSTGIPKEMHLDMSVGDKEFTSLDLFFDRQRKAYFFKGRQLALDDAWRSEDEIFGFNVSMFKEFHTEADEDE